VKFEDGNVRSFVKEGVPYEAIKTVAKEKYQGWIHFILIIPSAK
jgi:hypothetical protein